MGGSVRELPLTSEELLFPLKHVRLGFQIGVRLVVMIEAIVEASFDRRLVRRDCGRL